MSETAAAAETAAEMAAEVPNLAAIVWAHTDERINALPAGETHTSICPAIAAALVEILHRISDLYGHPTTAPLAYLLARTAAVELEVSLPAGHPEHDPLYDMSIAELRDRLGVQGRAGHTFDGIGHLHEGEDPGAVDCDL